MFTFLSLESSIAFYFLYGPGMLFCFLMLFHRNSRREKCSTINKENEMSCLSGRQMQLKHWHNTFSYMDLPLFHQCWKDYPRDGRSFMTKTFKIRFINLASLTYIKTQKQTANASGKSQVLSTLQKLTFPLLPTPQCLN